MGGNWRRLVEGEAFVDDELVLDLGQQIGFPPARAQAHQQHLLDRRRVSLNRLLISCFLSSAGFCVESDERWILQQSHLHARVTVV